VQGLFLNFFCLVYPSGNARPDRASIQLRLPSGVEITINTPALLFPAISLLMISYTTRFLHLANLARGLHALNPAEPEPAVLKQIRNLRKRIFLIRNMQATGITSLLLCVICMFLLFGGQVLIAEAFFGASLVLMIVSLLLSLWEIWISVDALNVHLRDIQEGKDSP
jgi:hypothetical protein